jgi:hypothetical protein
MRRFTMSQSFFQSRIACVGHAVALLAATALLAPGAASAQAQATPENPPASQPQSPPSSLDDLLDLDKERPQQPASGDDAVEAPGNSEQVAVDEARRELDKQLSEAEVADAFAQAVEKMGVAAEMLDVKFDASLTTQRVQEDIIAKLKQLLDQARRNQSQSSSSSSSSSQQQRQQQQQQQNPGQRQQQQNQDQNSQRNPNPADNRGEIDPPGMQEGDVNTVMEETRSEWGNLPQRLRDQLIQGRKDKFSSLYERLTSEYYRRLAEENSP